MTPDTPIELTPEQIAVVNAAHGSVYAQDPASKRRYRLVEQPIREEDLSQEELRAMLKVSIDQSDRGECKPWDPEEIKDELRRIYAERGIS